MSEAPDHQPKLAKGMTLQERLAAIESIKRGPAPEPMPIDRTAKEMTEAERTAFLAELKRRFP
jgi:hypothetical protein